MKRLRMLASLLLCCFMLGFTPAALALPNASIMPVTEVPLIYTDVLHIKAVFTENGITKAKGLKARFAQPDRSQMDDWHEPDDFPDSFQLIDQGEEIVFVLATDAKFYFNSVNEKVRMENSQLKNTRELKQKIEEDGYPAWIAEYKNGQIVKLTSLPLRIRSIYEVIEVYTEDERTFLWCVPQIMTEYPSIEDNRTYRTIGRKKYTLELAANAALVIQAHIVVGDTSRDYCGKDFTILEKKVGDEGNVHALLTIVNMKVQSVYVLYQP